jgi:CDP-diacylglycerol--serine O-phosphatidyltransferase
MRSPRAIIPVIPAALTLGNLVCGFVAMAKTVDAMTNSRGTGPLDPAFSQRIAQAAFFVLLGMLFDVLDGRIARLTRQTSPFGAMLDSLADIVTFGVTPALMAKAMYEHAKTGLDQPFFPKVVTALCAVYVIGAALRLARFTVGTDSDEASHHLFTGLPSPAAAAVLVTSCIFVYEGRYDVGLSDPWADGLAVLVLRSLPATACLLGLLMVSRVPYVHVVQRYVGHRTGVANFVKLVLVGAFLLLFYGWALFVVSWVYVIGGLALAVRARITGRDLMEALPAPWDEDDDESGDPWTPSRQGNGHHEGRP